MMQPKQECRSSERHDRGEELRPHDEKMPVKNGAQRSPTSRRTGRRGSRSARPSSATHDITDDAADITEGLSAGHLPTKGDGTSEFW